MEIKRIGMTGHRTTLDGLERFLVQGGFDADVSTTDMQYITILQIIKASLASVSDNTAPSTKLFKDTITQITTAITNITDAYGVANGLATLGSDGILTASQRPDVAPVVTEVATQVAMLALDAKQGDIAIRTDLKRTYILATAPATVLENWYELGILKALLDAHTVLTNNPHSVTKTQVGLSNVTNPGLAWGSTLTTDLKAITITGPYIYNASTTNAPTTDAGYVHATVFDGSNRILVATVSKSGVIEVYRMQMVANAWTAWIRDYEIDTVNLKAIFYDTTVDPVLGATFDVGSSYWDSDSHTHTFILENGVRVQLGMENVVYGTTGNGDLPNGTPVYVSGIAGQRPKFLAARADDPAKSKVTGIATHLITANGYVTVLGLVRDIPQSVIPVGETWVAGDWLYLALTGGMTNVEPAKGYPKVRLGQVLFLTGGASFTMLTYIRDSMGLGDLYDVDLTGATDGQVLQRVGGLWKPSDVVADHEVRIQELEGRKIGLYGFKKHKPTGACTPLFDSVALGSVPVIRGSRPAEFSNPYKDIRIFHWRSCLMDTKQRILAYYGQAGYDVPTHDSQSYEVEIPSAYIKQWEDEYYTYRVMSEAPHLPGMFIPGCFRDNLGREMPFAYVDKYRRGVLNGYSVSRPDVLPEVSITMNAAELKAEAVDTDTLWTGCPEELDWYITFVAEIMACNTDPQAAYGQGMSSMPYSASHTVVSVTTDANTVIVSNATADAFKVSMNVKLGSALGSGQSFDDRTIQSITDNGDGTSTIVVDGDPFTTVIGYILHAHRQVTTSYEAEQIGEDCGFILHNGRSESQVENWINGIAGHGGNVYEFSFGLLRYDNYVYLCHDRYQFKHNDDPRNNSAFKNVGFFEQTDGGSYGWIKNMVMVGEEPYVMEWVQELGAGSTTHYADVAYYLTPTYRGTRIVRRRFNWGYGSVCGRRGLAGYYVLSFSAWSFGWRASPSKLVK